MTIRKLSNLCVILGAALLSVSKAAERAETFSEALSKAGSDGVIAYCYGPDWNRRSVRLLKTFWNTPEAAEAAGNAVMVAVPFYEDSDSPGAEDESRIRSGMAAPEFDVCPTVVFYDKNGRLYASLQGSDYLGNDEQCTLGIANIGKTIQALRKQQELMAKAETEEGAKKADILAEVAELPIQSPPGLLDMIKEADPKDKAGYARRLEFNARAFMYKQLDTKDGFLHPDFVPNYNQIMKECEAVFKDEALRSRDRQAVYNLYIGQSRREHIQSNKLKGLIRKVNKLDANTDYGQLSPTLMQLWGSLKHKPSRDDRREAREKKRAKDKEKRAKKRGERNVEIN